MNRISRLFALTFVVLFATALGFATTRQAPVQAQDDMMTHTCDSTLILLLYIAEYDYGFKSMMDVSTFEKGQYAPLFEMMMAQMEEEMMTEDDMMAEMTEEAMMDDLSYYGFDNIESIPISVNIPAKDLMKNSNSILDTYNNKIQASEKDLKEWTDKHRQKIDNMIQEFKDEANCLNTEIRVMKFARDCFKEAMEKEPTKMTLYKFYPIEYDANKELREKHLNMFGLSWTGKYSQTTGFEITYYEK
ncbi:MAG: hypothetical protein MUE54_11185 [Anaerolineae bacterium]|nr:hypothetical protein [Anaerolineae bacterium]